MTGDPYETNAEMLARVTCATSDLHPFECSGPGRCDHCDRRLVVFTGDEGTSSYAHHPGSCPLCDDSGER